MPATLPKKLLLTILLSCFISAGAAARLVVLGWMGIVGLATIAIFGIAHMAVHLYCIKHVTNALRKSIGLVIISQFLFLNLFLFQRDGGDSRSYVVLEYITNSGGATFYNYSTGIWWASLILYIVVAIGLVKAAKKAGQTGGSSWLVAVTLGCSILFTAILISGHLDMRNFF